jgi:hypothetical protein
LNNQKSSRIVPAMKRTSLILLLLVASALPAAAQSKEFGFIVGGSRRFVNNDRQVVGEAHDDAFALSNNVFELYAAVPVAPETSFKLNLGRMEGSVGFATDNNRRVDAEGEIQHIDALVQYEFDEPYGSTAIFGGVGFYRQTADGQDDETAMGVQAGINADFPINRRYGVVAQAAYHWIQFELRPRYVTLGAGLRVSF